MMCGTSSSSEGAWSAADQCCPPSLENDSHPMSLAEPSGFVPWVSHAAYRLPPASSPIAVSIHHSASDMVPASGATLTGVDHVLPWSVDAVKYSLAGSIA